MSVEIIRPRRLPPMVGLSRTTIWRLEKKGEFPKRIRLSAGAIGYYRAEIEAWLAERQAVANG